MTHGIRDPHGGDKPLQGDTVEVKYRLRAKYLIRAKTLKLSVDEYYAPEVNSVAPQVQLEVPGH